MLAAKSFIFISLHLLSYVKICPHHLIKRSDRLSINANMMIMIMMMMIIIINIVIISSIVIIIITIIMPLLLSALPDNDRWNINHSLRS